MSLDAAPRRSLERVIKMFEFGIVVALIAMMMLVISLSTVKLGWLIVIDIVTPPILLLEISEFLEIFGFFLLIMIGVELLETVKAYLQDNVVHVDLVLEVALIAIARKVIVLDVSAYGGLSLMAIAVLVITLAAALHLARRARSARASTTSPSTVESGGLQT